MTFPGTLRATTLSVSIPREVNGWNCIGNPFTAPLKIRGLAAGSFIYDNSAQFQTGYAAIYIYDPAQPSYYKILNNTDVGGRYIDQDYVQPGQGFQVRAVSGGGTVDFTPAMRNYSSNNFYKKSTESIDPWSKIILKAKSSGQDVTTNILFRSDMTLGVDESYDAGLPEWPTEFNGLGTNIDLPDKNQEIKLYTRLVKDIGVNFAIQCLPDSETEDMIVPIGLEFPAGGIVTFTAENILLPKSYKSVLEDRQLGIFTDLKTQGAKYDAILPIGTKGTGRFFLHTLLKAPNILKSEILKKITSYAVGKEIFVKGQVSENTNAILYDLYGRKLKTVVLNPSDMNSFRVDELAQGIYILKVTGNEIQESNRIYIE